MSNYNIKKKAIKNKPVYARKKKYTAEQLAKKKEYKQTFAYRGGQLGKQLGTIGGQLLQHFIGRGAYRVKNNSLLRNNGNPDMPKIINVNSSKYPGGVLFRKSEYLGDVISAGSNTFHVQNFNVNPALSNTFPWLAQCAANFEQYEIIGMYFEYRSMSADALNSTNTALGQVILAADYNAGNANFSTKHEMENYEGAISVKPSESVRYFLECAKSQSPLSCLYTRSGEVPEGEDIKTYDLCNFQIATNGLQHSTPVNLGELWISYEIVCFKTKLFDSLNNNCLNYMARSTNYSSLLPFKDFNQFATSNTLKIELTDTTITFPKAYFRKKYFIQVGWYTTGAAVTVVYPTVTPTNIWVHGAQYPNDGISAKALQYSAVLVVEPHVIGVLTFGTGGTLPTSPGIGKIFINEIAENTDQGFYNT